MWLRFIVPGFVIWLPVAVQAASPEFIAFAADGTRGRGTMVDWSEKDGLTLDGDKPFHLKNGDLVELRRVGGVHAIHPAGAQLILRCGDRLGLDSSSDVKLVPESGGKLQVQSELGRETWTVPLSHIALFWRAPPQGTVNAEALRLELAASARKRKDLVLLSNGDRIEALVETWDESAKENNGLKIQSQRNPIAPAKLAAIVFQTEDTTPPKAPCAKIILADGSRLSLTEMTCDARRLLGKSLFGTEVRVPMDDVVAIRPRQDPAVYLSDLKPSKVEETAFLSGGSVSFGADRSAGGEELFVGGQCYDKGLGTRSGTTLTYALDGKYKRFEAVVGLDDVSGKLGTARVKILVDGKARELPGLVKDLKWRAAGVEVSLDVSGAKELTLVIEAGTSGSVQDHVDWGNARLVR